MSAWTTRGRFSIGLLASVVLFPWVVRAASPSPTGAPAMEVLDLDAYVERAIKAAPELDVARWGVSSQEADLQKAQASRFLPEFSAINNFGFAPIARGTVLEPLDTVDTSSYGPFTSVEIRLVQPIFTWGKISDGIAAAAHAVGAKLAERDGVEAAVVEQAKTLYYNIVLALSLIHI